MHTPRKQFWILFCEYFLWVKPASKVFTFECYLSVIGPYGNTFWILFFSDFFAPKFGPKFGQKKYSKHDSGIFKSIHFPIQKYSQWLFKSTQQEYFISSQTEVFRSIHILNSKVFKCPIQKVFTIFDSNVFKIFRIRNSIELRSIQH